MASVASRPAAATPTITRPSLFRRLYGFGSVYGKTVRDSRLAFLIVAGLMGGIMLVAGAGIGTAFATPESRAELARLATEVPPILQGLTGKAVNVGTIGGYVTWKYGPYFVFVAAIWSILALSGTLASEARRGSLEFVAASPFGKRRLALEKLAAHVVVMIAAVAVLGVAAWLTGALFGSLPGDAVTPEAALGFAVWVGLIALASGGIAFALAPFIGRAGAGGIAGFVLLAGYFLNGYAASVPAFAGPANLSWFAWTANHIPLAGQFDWLSLVPVAIAVIVLFVIGVEAFSRRDLGSTSSIPTPSLPGAVLGLRGPVGRSFGERLPLGIAWGIGLGFFGLVIAAASRSLADSFAQLGPDTIKIIHDLLPNIDITSAGGFLQFVFGQIGFIIVGFAAATLVAGWASDEGSGRLEMLLATPLARARWAVRSGLGVFAAIVAMNVVFAAAVGFGAILAGSDALTPMVGTAALGLYAIALAGVGFAIGGLLKTSIAAEIIALIVTVTFLIDIVVPALRLPDWVHQLALTAHMGQSLIGNWDPAGIAACLVLAVGGLAISAIGIGRRDIAR